MKRDLSGIYILEPFYLHFKLCILHLSTVAKHNRQKLQTSTFECFKHKVRCYSDTDTKIVHFKEPSPLNKDFRR